MAEITAALVKELREETSVGMMECKKALVDANGDKAKAIQLLRERGIAVAGKKAGREVKSGLIAAKCSGNRQLGVMIEVNCETDFVARNDVFKGFVHMLLDKAETVDGELAPLVTAEVNAAIQKTGENTKVRRNIKYTVQGEGLIASYIHLGSKLGVIVEIGATKKETAANAAVLELANNLTLHIAANTPPYLNRAAVPPAVIAAEREIYAKQVENKPANIVEKIVAGKIDKYLSTQCCVEQPYLLDANITVAQALEACGKAAGDTLTLRRYDVYRLGG